MSADTPTPVNCFVRASELWSVSRRERILHPAKEATDRDVRRAVEELEESDRLADPEGATDRDVRRAVETLENDDENHV